MADLAKLSIHQVTLLQQCTTPQFIETMAHHDVRCASLWRDKVREHGVERTAALVADSGITMSGYCFGGLVTSPDAREAARARDDVRRALDEAAALGAPCLVFVAGGVDPAEKSIANARTRALDGIADLIPHARSVGVKLAIEPLHPMICATRSVLSTVGQANRWCDKLAADDIVGIAVDTYASMVGPGPRGRDRARRQADLRVPRQRLARRHPGPALRPRDDGRRRHRHPRDPGDGRTFRLRRLGRSRDLLAAQLVEARHRRGGRDDPRTLRERDLTPATPAPVRASRFNRGSPTAPPRR